MTEWVSQSEAVRLLADLGDNISQQALSQYLKGHPEVVRRDQGPGRSQLIDWNALKKSRGTRASRGPASQAQLPLSELMPAPTMPPERTPERSGETVDLSARRARADTDRAEFEARRARILAEQAEGKLISRDDAVSAFTASGIALTRAFEEGRLVAVDDIRAAPERREALLAMKAYERKVRVAFVQALRDVAANAVVEVVATE